MSRPSRRDLLRLGAAALAGLPVLRANPAIAAPDAGSAPDAGPWPSAEKLVNANRDLIAQLHASPLTNGDAPDLLPHPTNRRVKR